MADKTITDLFDADIKAVLLRTQARQREQELQDRVETFLEANPGHEIPNFATPADQVFNEGMAHLEDLQSQTGGRSIGEHVQDAGVGLMGTLGAIGTTAVLGGAAAVDAIGNATGTLDGWDNTQRALELAQSTSEYWNSLQSEKSKAFDRVSAYRQQQALDQANLEAQSEHGRDANMAERLGTSFVTGVENYLDAPGQIITDSLAQLPYLLTGGAAKAATGALKGGRLMAQLTKHMSQESAEKLLQMGIVGGTQGTIEGASAAAQAYDRVMRSTDTFGPGEEAAREMAALEAAGKAFGIAGLTSAVTGTLASKWELAPFTAKGSTSLARTGDNLIKGLLEGTQETIESGTSQFASNYAGNEALKGKDRVALDEGVGEAAGAGFVVGMGSTGVTNPRSGVDAVLAPLSLAGRGLSNAAARASNAEASKDMAAARNNAAEIVANITTPASTAAMQSAGPSMADEIELPPEIDTSTQVGLFATSMEYLKTHSDKTDPATKFHVLGTLLETAHVLRNLREGAKTDAADESLSPEHRADAAKNLEKLNALVSEEKLNELVDTFPFEDIEGELNDLQAQSPEAFSKAVAYIAALNPMKVTTKLADAALESKTLPEEQRQSLLLTKELKEAEAELQVGPNPDMSEVSRSIMHTGFPGASERKPSIGHMVADVTSALDQNDPESAQALFNRLVNFARYMDAKATRFEQAKTEIAESGKPRVEIPEYHRFHEGKLDENKPAFLTNTPKSLALPAAIRRDAEMVKKVVSALQKRTGLEVKTPPKAPGKPAKAAPAKAAPVEQPRQETPQKVSEPAPEQAAPAQKETTEEEEVDELSQISDEALDQEITTLSEKIRRRRKNDTANAVEQDIRYNNLVREKARRVQTSPEPALKKAVDKSVDKKPAPKAEPVAAPVDIQMEPETPASKPQTKATLVMKEQEEAAPASVEEQAPEPSRNHYTDLQPSYPVAEGATVAERNDAINHLAHSFTTSKEPGLVSRLPATAADLVEQLGTKDPDDIKIARGVFGLKDTLIQRLNEGLAKVFPKVKRKAMLQGQNFWKNENGHSLYAATWSEDSIQYDSVIAEVMAWTGIQHLMDLVYPMAWSEEAKGRFVETYGEKILPMLEDGWVPLPNQITQMAQKLQTNLELHPDTTVPREFTEGTMMALAMDTISVMAGEGSNRPLQLRQVATNKGPLVQWVRVAADPDLMFDAARTMENFFPDRASTAAGIIGEKPAKVNPFYRGSRQKVGKEQKQALLKMSQTSHKLSPLMFSLWEALPREAKLKLFGYDLALEQELREGNRKPETMAEISKNGANHTLMGDLRVISNHIRALRKHVSEQEEAVITEVPSYFEYEMVTNGRAMTKGTSPQSSKLYRELFSTVQQEIDPAQLNRGFMMAVAQGLGIKMDKQPINDSLAQLDRWLAQPSVKAAIKAASRLTSGDTSQLDNDIAAIQSMKDDQGKGIEVTAHALSALTHIAKYQEGKPFVSSLSYEIDGLTDGPVNLLMLMGLQGNASQMEGLLGLAGLWFGDEKISVQDRIEHIQKAFNGAKDYYEIIADTASDLNNERAEEIMASVPAHQKQKTRRMLQAILHLMQITKMSESNLKDLRAKHSRGFTKLPTTASGYQQGPRSIITALTDNLLEAISFRNDANQMTDGDWAAVDMLMSHKLVYSKKKGQYFLIEEPADLQGLKWDGRPLTKSQRDALAQTLTTFGGSGLANATLRTVGYQRARMEAAVELVNAHIRYANDELRKAYKAKQDAGVAAGNLQPGHALSTKDENALIKEIWERIIPLPMLRNTAGLPTASTSRSAVPVQDTRRVVSALFDRQNMQVSEAAFEDPGVAFAALSIIASGDGSMMAGFFQKTSGNYLNMYDGIYIDPSEIDQVQEAINKEVKRNWEYDYIGAVLGSLKMDDPGFKAWAEQQVLKDGDTLYPVLESAVELLKQQQQTQTQVMREINARPHSVSHMAAGENPYWEPGTALNSTTLGTSQTDPLLDLAADSLGEASNGIRKLSAADVKALLQEHTFENPVLSGLWKVLAPLVNDDLLVYLSSDKVGLAEFYKQNERREMGTNVDGISVGNRVYVRAINAETLVHELLHATTKNLTATFFAQPGALSAQQQAAMKNLLALQAQFQEMDISGLPAHQQTMIEHVRAVMRTLDPNSAMQEFLAYGLTNYHLQRSLKTTKSKLGQLVEGVFNAVKALFGFPNGTQSDSMLAHMFSNFALLTEEAGDTVYPVSVDEALNSIGMAQRFGEILTELERVVPTQDALVASQRAHTISQAVGARADGRTRMQALADTNLFPKLTNEQMSAAEYVQALFSAGLQFKASENSLLAHIVDAVRQAGPVAWRDNSDPNDQEDIDRAQARYDYFFQDNIKHDQVADILSMYLVNPEFAKYMDQQVLPHKKIDKSTFDGLLDSVAAVFYEKSDTGFGLGKGATLGKALETAAERLHKSMLQSAKRKQTTDKVGPYRRMQEKLAEGVQFLGEKAGKLSEKQLAANRTVIGNTLMVLAGLANDRYADMVGSMVLSMTDEMEKFTPFREVMQEMVGTNPSNYQLIKLKGVAARMISAIRQSFREQVPVTVKGWFSNLTEEQDELLHKVIGKMAIYSLSQDLKDRMEEILTDPTNAKLEAEATLMSSGNRTQRMLMIKYAKHLGDQMALKGNQALYQNTRAIEGLAANGGGHRLSETEFAALENLSTLQALSHLTPNQRRQILSLFRDNTDGFWKTTALINTYVNLDTQRAGKFSASLNFQKGYIPVESDNRKKLKLFQPSEVRNAERKGWVKVGEAKDGSGLVYMATTVGKTPTLSGGAIHAVDMHMNGVHYHSGLPTDPSIQTLITHPKQVREIMQKIANGGGSGYVALYDAAGDLEGFQRRLDPVLVDRHTKTVGRISDAAGIWLGRLHEERFAHERNQAAADLLRKTWDEAKADKRENEFVNIRQPYDPASKGHQKVDKVLQNIWNTLPYHTKRQLEAAFADGSQNPPIWIRRSQLNDAIGYHKASVGNFFTGDNRYEKSTNDNVAALARQVLGKDAYKYLVMAEEGWQALVGSAKDTIIVKSLVVALNNLASNQTQLLMVTGNPIWNLRVQSQKHKEVVAYLNYQQRIARLTAEGLASNDARTKAKIDSEQAFLKREMRKLSIYPLIEAGELPSIAEGLSEIEEFSMVGDFTAWMEKQMGKMPPAARTVLRNLAVSKETSLYKGLDRMIQYGDFVAKATMYEWLTTQDKAARQEALDMVKTAPVNAPVKFADALHELALKEINDEFVNYARLPGRWRTYGEDMGLLWFYNYKLRIMKMTFRRMRKNPFGFLMASQAGGLLGIDTLVDTLPWNVNFGYATGIDPLFSAHQSILWTQMF